MYIVSGIGIGAATFEADTTRPSRTRTGRDFEPWAVSSEELSPIIGFANFGSFYPLFFFFLFINGEVQIYYFLIYILIHSHRFWND